MKALTLVALVSLAAACAEPSPLDVTADADRGRDGPGRADRITVMTRNLYVGADVDQVIGALVSPDPADDLPTLIGAIQTLAETDFPTRAKAIALEIDRARPVAVGLQEVSTIDIDLNPLGYPITVKQDFLAILLRALAARGLDYRAVASITNIQANPVPGVSLTDRDVLLVDRRQADVAGNPVARTYAVNIGQVAPGVTLIRGFVVADLRVGGRSVTVASSHLESGAAGGLDQLRAAQAAELAQILPTDRTAVIVGDLNDVPTSPMAQLLTGSGFVDLWPAFHKEGSGFTCCQVPNLGNERSRLDQRIDYVWVRSHGPVGGTIDRVGDQVGDRIAGPAHPIWPSDHAGVVATFGLGSAAEGRR